jgi:hypothetical protein
MGNHEYGTNEYEKALKSHESAQEQLTALQKEWEGLYERVEK